MKLYCRNDLYSFTVLIVAAVIPLLSGCGSSSRSSCTVYLPGKVSLTLVELPYGILFGKYEVTQRQWEAVMGNNPSYNKSPENPVECVSWDDSQTFLEKLNTVPSVQKAGLVFRLPRLSEQLYARYAGSAGSYCRLADGTEITETTIGRVAWIGDNSGGKTHPVGLKEPNAFQLYDMFGNVFELCQDSQAKSASMLLSWVEDNRIKKCIVAGGGCFITEQPTEFSSQTAGAVPCEFNAPGLGLRVCAFRVGQKEVKRRIQERIREETAMFESMEKATKAIISDMVPIPGKNYYIGKYEITQSQWETVMRNNPSLSKGADKPVGEVSWRDCQAFLKKVNKHPEVRKSGLVFRLPTEEEWEYACRAGGTGDYCKLADGTEITKETLGRVAWYKDNTDRETRSHPVGQKVPNAFGLYDMHGNEAEWTKTVDGENYVVCGGDWNSSPWFCESSFRIKSSITCGFRLCADKETSQAPNTATKESPKNTGTVVTKDRSQVVKSVLDSMVSIPGKDYKVGKTEVTQEQWEAVMGGNPSEFKGATNPVENISWNDCKEFLKKFNELPEVKEANLMFRLPTEEEWEHACQAGATGMFCKLANNSEITEETLGQVAWFDDNSGGKTHPVGQKEPNAFGLYDMHGNVWEWTQTAAGRHGGYLGGGWNDSAEDCEFSDRFYDSADLRLDCLGFRLCAEKR